MIQNVSLLLGLICLLIYPWPTLNEAQILFAGHVFWIIYTLGLVLGVAAHYLYFVASDVHYILGICIILLLTAVLRQTWRGLFGKQHESANIIMLCVAALDGVQCIFMWVGGQWVAALLLAPVIGLDVYRRLSFCCEVL
jgi:hypothetical protein